MQSRTDRLERERDMSPVRRSDNDYVDVGRVIPEFLCPVNDSRLRVRASGLRLSFRIAGNDRRKIQSGRRFDQWSVKDCSSDSVADQGDAKHATARFCVAEIQYCSVPG